MRHLLKCIALTLGLWTCLGAAALAAPEGAAGPAAEKADQPLVALDIEAPPGDAADGVVRPADDILNDMVSLEFRDADLQDVLRLITKKSGLNVIMNPGDVKGKVTLRLENVRLGVALDEILRVNGLARMPRTENNIVRIVTAKAAGIKDVETATEVVPINFASAVAVAAVLKDFLTEGVGKAIADKETNSLIITDTPTQIEVIKNDLLKKIDKEQLQVLIELRLVEMTEKALRNLGSQLSLTRLNPGGVVGSLSQFVPATAAQSALLSPGGAILQPFIPGVPAHFEDAAAGNAPIGADGKTHIFPGNQTQLKSVLDSATLLDPQFALGRKVAILGTDFNFSALFQLKEVRDDVEVLAQPRVVTLNNLEASIDIVRQIPYIKEQSAETGVTGAGAPTKKIDFLQEGIKIVTTPVITQNGFVRMSLTTEQKIQSGVLESTPIIDERKAKTSILVRSGETAMLGGLRQFTQTRTVSGIPWFHRIPVLGWFFKSTSTNQQKNDLYLFVTPTILDHPELNVDEKGIYDRIDHKAGLPDYYMDDVSAPGDIMN